MNPGRGRRTRRGRSEIADAVDAEATVCEVEPDHHLTGRIHATEADVADLPQIRTRSGTALDIEETACRRHFTELPGRLGEQKSRVMTDRRIVERGAEGQLTRVVEAEDEVDAHDGHSRTAGGGIAGKREGKQLA